MGTAHGKNQVFKIEDVGGTMRDLTLFCRSIDGIPGDDADVVDDTTMGQSSATFVRGISKGDFSIEGTYDSQVTSGPDVVLNGIRTSEATSTFEYGPEGGGPGKVKYTGECFCTGYTVSGDYDGLVMFAAKFQIDGPITRSTFA